MKEGSLKPGDIINNKWVIDSPIGGGIDHGPCVYSCHHKDHPEHKLAMKIREKSFPGSSDPKSGQHYLLQEVEKLQRINKDGPHPSFQELVDYNDDPDNLYLIMKPLMDPKRGFFKLSQEELKKINIFNFLKDFFHAVRYAHDRGIDLISNRQHHSHLFVTEDGKPFFLGLSDELEIWNPFITWDLTLFEDIIARFRNGQTHIRDLQVKVSLYHYNDVNRGFNPDFEKFFIELGWLTFMNLYNQ